MNKEEEYKLRIDRVVRWDQYRINHLTYTNNLILTINLAFLGFFITSIGFQFNQNCWLFLVQFLALFFLMGSFVCGVTTVFIRLKDFRFTARLTKARKKVFEQNKDEKKYSDIHEIEASIPILKAKTDKLGNQTWTFLIIQIGSFVAGAFFGVIYLFLM